MINENIENTKLFKMKCHLNVVLIFKLKNDKAIFITARSFELIFGKPSRNILRAKILYISSDMRIIYHEHTIENYDLYDSILRFSMKLECQLIEYINIEDIKFRYAYAWTKK
jgi:hypothetical protein